MREIVPWRVIGQIHFTSINLIAVIEYRVTNGSAYYHGESNLKVERPDRAFDVEGSLINLGLRQSMSEGFVVCQRGKVDEGMRELAKKVSYAIENLV